MKRGRAPVQLSERQYLLIAVLLVILITISLLYCVGLGSLVLRQVWRNTPTPPGGTLPTGENETSPASVPEHSPLPTPTGAP